MCESECKDWLATPHYSCVQDKDAWVKLAEKVSDRAWIVGSQYYSDRSARTLLREGEHRDWLSLNTAACLRFANRNTVTELVQLAQLIQRVFCSLQF